MSAALIDIESMLRSHSRELNLPEIGSWKFHFVSTGSLGIEGSLTRLVFLGKEMSPRWVVKSPRNSQFSETIRAEYQILSELKDRLRGTLLSPTLSEALLMEEIDGTTIAVFSYLPGERLVLSRHSSESDLHRVGKWLGQFQTLTRVREIGKYWLSERMHSSLQMLREAYAIGREQEMYLERLASGIDHLIPRLFACSVHNDFVTGNIRIGKQHRIGVFDWQLSEMIGLPIADVVSFIASAAIERTGLNYKNEEQIEKEALNDDRLIHAFRRTAQEFLPVYAEFGGLDPVLVMEALPYAATEIAVTQWKQFGIHSGADLIGWLLFRLNIGGRLSVL